MTPAPGSSPIPGFRLGNVLRSDGAGGALVRAYDLRAQREVVLKLVARVAGGDPLAEERLRREAHAAARVHHPSVVRVLDLGETDDWLWIVMAPVPGPDAATRLLDRGPLTVADACAAGRDAGRGLAALHAAGVVHRDVAPGNLVLPARGPAVVVDLGLARLRGAPALTEAGVLLGTPAYMAPEQLDDPRAVDGGADVYGLAATLVFLLTGRPPYEERGGELLARLRAGGAPDLRTLRPDAPAALADLVARALAGDRGMRPDAAAFAAACAAIHEATSPLLEAVPAAVAPTRAGVGAGFAMGLLAALMLALIDPARRGTGTGDGETERRRGGEAERRAGTGDGETERRRGGEAEGRTGTGTATGDGTFGPTADAESAASAALDAAEQLATAAAGAEPSPEALAALADVEGRFPGTHAAFRAWGLRAEAEGRRRATWRAAATTAIGDARIALDEARFADAWTLLEQVGFPPAPAPESAALAELALAITAAADEALIACHRRALARAADGSEHEGIALLEAHAATTLRGPAAEARRHVLALRADAARAREARAASRAAEALGHWPEVRAEAEADLARRRPGLAAGWLAALAADPAWADARPDCLALLADAHALDGFFRHLGAALAAKVGLRLPRGVAPGGIVRAVEDGVLHVGRADGEVHLRLADQPVAALVALAAAVWPLGPPDPADAHGLGLLAWFDGDAAAALPWFDAAIAQGAPAGHRRAAAAARVAAERARALAEVLRAAREALATGRPGDALERLDGAERLAAGDADPSVADEFRALRRAAGGAATGLRGLVAGQLRPARAGEIELSFAADDPALDTDAEAGEPTRWLRPRFLGTVEVTADGADASVAVRPAGGGPCLAARLGPDRRLVLSLDGADVGHAAGATPPLVLRRDGAGVRATAGSAALADARGAGSGPVHVGGPSAVAWRVRGRVDPGWVREARARADRPGPPVGLTATGPLDALRLTWDAPATGVAVGYRVRVAVVRGEHPLDPLSAFEEAARVAVPEWRLRASRGGVAVLVEALDREGKPGPAAGPLYFPDLRGAGALAIGPGGECYVSLPGPVPVVRVDRDGRPRAVAGAPLFARGHGAPPGLAVRSARYGPAFVLLDRAGRCAWSWSPDAPPAPFGGPLLRWPSGVALAADGVAWVADPGEGTLVAMVPGDARPVVVARSPATAVALLPDGRLALVEAEAGRVWVGRAERDGLSGAVAVEGLRGPGACAALDAETLLVAESDGVAWLDLRAGRVRARVVEAGGVALRRVVGLAADPRGVCVALDAAAGRLVTLPSR